MAVTTNYSTKRFGSSSNKKGNLQTVSKNSSSSKNQTVENTAPQTATQQTAAPQTTAPATTTNKSGGTSGGVTYDPNTNYAKLINEAYAKGDYQTAAKYEQQRNAKVDDMNAAGTNTNGYTTTSDYAGWLDNTQYGTLGLQQIAYGASPEVVQQTYNDRYNKAANTIGMEQYLNDATMQQMLAYINSAETTELPEFDEEYWSRSQPTFNDNYAGISEELFNKILSREDFKYDPNDDPLYGYYQDMYRREGDRARENTLADIASSAGGMNSWAVTAAQQAQNSYNAQMTDKIPELYQLAYQMYLNDKASEVENLGLVNQMSDRQYNRYMDQMGIWRNDRDFAYGIHRDDMGDYQWGKTFNYGIGQDQISNNQWQQSFDTSNEQWDKQFAASQDETAYNREQAEQQNARAWALDLIASGVTPDSATLQAAGLTLEQAKQILASEQASGSRSSGGSPSSNGVNPGSGVYQQMYDAGINSEGAAYTWLTSNGVKYSEASKLAQYYRDMLEDGSLEENTTDPNRLYDISIKKLGIKDDVSDETIATLLSMGALVDDGNYGYKWASGWNSDNWMAKYLKEKGFAPTLKPVGTSVK